jgi:hypothetical protein
VSEKHRLPNAVRAVVERPVKKAVHEALAEASVTVVTDDPGAESWRDADGVASDDGDTATDAEGEGEDGSVSPEDGDSRSRRRRGLLGLAALVSLAALAAFVQYRRERRASGSDTTAVAGAESQGEAVFTTDTSG